MKQQLSIIFFLLTGTIALSQNLVPNPSFEFVNKDSAYSGNIVEAIPWSSANQYTPNLHTSRMPNTLTTCWFHIPNNGYNPQNSGPGYQYARTGHAMGRFVTYSNSNYFIDWEYIMVQLNNALDSGITYRLGFYTNLANRSNWAIDRMGMYISSSNPYQNMGVLPYIPQIESQLGVHLADTVGWMLISDTLTATGSEQYICIGNFHAQQYVDTLAIYHPWFVPGTYGSVHYFIDDVFICPIDSTYPVADIGLTDTLICKGDSVQLGTRNDSNYYYRWWPKIGLSSDSTGITWAKPLITTKYYLEATDDCFKKTYDSIIVYVQKCGPNAGMDTTVCKESQLILGDSSNIGYQCQWQPSTYLSSDTVPMPQMSCMSSMTYYLTVYNGSVIIKTDSIKIIVGACYSAEAGIDTTLCLGDSIQIGTHNYSSCAYVWWPNQWLSDSTIGMPFTKPDTLIKYFLQVIDTLGNISVDSIVIGVIDCDTVGINQLVINNQELVIYPNPASGFIIIEFNELQHQDCVIEIYDNLGRKLMERVLKQGKNQYQIQTGKLESGVYFYKLEAGEIYNGKIIISK